MYRISMRKILLVVALITLMTSASFPVDARASVVASDLDRTMEVGGRERTYHVHVPAMLASAAGMPVLIVLHGGGGNGAQVERSTGFSELADKEGFVAVYPDGTGRLSRRLTWDAHNCCAYAYSQQVDDVGFISAMIEQVIAEFDVDSSRVYITGHSNGAMMTFRVACELSDKIAAAAPYAGTLNTDDCSPDHPVPILIMNGADDDHVPVAGGNPSSAGHEFDDTRVDRPTSFAVATWVANDGCLDAPKVVETLAATTTTYADCAGGSMVQQTLIHGWGHNWPRIETGAPLDAGSVIWEFVSQFSKSAP